MSNLREWLDQNQTSEAPEIVSLVEIDAAIAAVKKTQKIGSGERLKKSSKNFLIVDDKGVGHLPIPDRAHWGYAWAALTTGFRGKVYSGPGKAKALARLRKMYHDAGLKTPDEK